MENQTLIKLFLTPAYFLQDYNVLMICHWQVPGKGPKHYYFIKSKKS